MQAHKCMQRKMRATKQHALAVHIHLQNAQRSFEKRNCMLHLGMGTCGCARNGDADDNCGDRGCPVSRSSAGGRCGMGGRAVILFLVILSSFFPFPSTAPRPVPAFLFPPLLLLRIMTIHLLFSSLLFIFFTFLVLLLLLLPTWLAPCICTSA